MQIQNIKNGKLKKEVGNNLVKHLTDRLLYGIIKV